MDCALQRELYRSLRGPLLQRVPVGTRVHLNVGDNCNVLVTSADGEVQASIVGHPPDADPPRWAEVFLLRGAARLNLEKERQKVLAEAPIPCDDLVELVSILESLFNLVLTPSVQPVDNQ